MEPEAKQMYWLLRRLIPEETNKKLAFVKTKLAEQFPGILATEMTESMDSFLLAILALSDIYDGVHKSDARMEDH